MYINNSLLQPVPMVGNWKLESWKLKRMIDDLLVTNYDGVAV